MKRSAMFLLTAAMGLSLTACGKAADDKTADDTVAEDQGTGTNTDTEGAGQTGGSGGDEASGAASGVTIEYAVNYQQDAQASVMEEIIQAFEEETGIHVELTLSGADHEAVMKTRMASGDLPDLWNTHGWSVMRYKEFLTPLNDQPWFGDIDDSVKGAVADQDGNVYVLPIGEGTNGIIYNQDVLEDNGIDAVKIRTVDDMSAAMETLAAAGITPMVISNSDKTNNAHFLDSYLAAYLTCADLDTDHGAALLEGTFDWEASRPAWEQMAQWWSKGYWNVDALSAARDSNFSAVANGEAAFMFFTNDGINAIHDLAPDAALGVMPMPATKDGGLMTWGVSEGNNSCIGVWKDTEHMDACLSFLSYLARPEVAKRVIVEIEGGIPALTTLDVEGSYSIDVIREGQAAFAGKVDYVTYFDQAYLPSGMWGILKEAASAFFEGEGGTEQNIDAAIRVLQENYEDMYEG